jgi:hypothetical protein
MPILQALFHVGDSGSAVEDQNFQQGGAGAWRYDDLAVSGMFQQVRAGFRYHDGCFFRGLLAETKLAREPPRISARLRNPAGIVNAGYECRHSLQAFPSEDRDARTPARLGLDLELIREPLGAA